MNRDLFEVSAATEYIQKLHDEVLRNYMNDISAESAYAEDLMPLFKQRIEMIWLLEYHKSLDTPL